MRAALVAAARLLPLALVVPLGPLSVRLLVGGALAAAVAAGLGGAESLLAAGPIPVLLGEAVAGLALGLPAAALIRAGEAAGGAVDAVRAGAVARRSDGGGFALLGRLAALATFAGAGGPLLLVDAVGRSYAALPAGYARPQPGAALAVVDVLGATFTAAVELAAPVLVALLVADLLLALLRRSAPSLMAGVGAPGGAAARELFAVLAVLATGGTVLALLAAQSRSLGEAMAVAAGALGGPR